MRRLFRLRDAPSPSPPVPIVPDFEFEQRLWAEGMSRVAGVDECGRGPLAGPVIAGATVFRPGADARALGWARDSKSLGAKRIRALAEAIRDGEFRDAGLLAWGLGGASVREIDRLNIRRASILAMERALSAAQRRLGEPIEFTLVDGSAVPEMGRRHETVVRGDGRSISIACGSILAKDCRDRLMERLALRYPQFGCWASDRGYASPAHRAALLRHGPVTGHHRTSFRPVAQLSLI